MPRKPEPWIVEMEILCVEGRSKSECEMPDELSARRLVDMCRCVPIVMSAKARPLSAPVKERRCDLGAACICTKAGWRGPCIAERVNASLDMLAPRAA